MSLDLIGFSCLALIYTLNTRYLHVPAQVTIYNYNAQNVQKCPL